MTDPRDATIASLEAELASLRIQWAHFQNLAEEQRDELEAELERVKIEREAGFKDIDGRIEMVATRLAVGAWFDSIYQRGKDFDVEAFKKALREELFNAACDLASPYRDRAETAESTLAKERKEKEKLREALEPINRGLEQSRLHDVGGEKMRRILVADTAYQRIRTALAQGRSDGT